MILWRWWGRGLSEVLVKDLARWDWWYESRLE